jgi:hypothetical protein
MQRPRRLNPCLWLALAASLVFLACPNDPPPELQRVVVPVFSPTGGLYYAVQTVHLSTITAGASINYTTDGTDPNSTSGTPYTVAGISVNSTTTIKAIAYKDGMLDSYVVSNLYNIDLVPAKVPTPDIVRYDGLSQPSDIFTTSPQVYPTCALSGATIMYTTDGTDPTPAHGTQWTTGYIPGITKRTVVKAMAYKSGSADSDIKEVFYDVFSPAVNVGNSSSAHSALCLDPADKHHLVYWSKAPLENDKLMYTTDAGGSWLSTPEVVYTTTFDMNWQWMAIGVTSTGDVHVVAMRNIGGGLRHFIRSHTDGTWSLPTVVDSTEGTNFVGQYVSMVVDSTDKVRVVYYDAAPAALNVKHAYFDGAAWHASALESGGAIGEYCSVDIDSGNFMHISWYDATNSSLVYRSSVDDSMTTIDNDGVGKWSSIAVDGNDRIHISYFDEAYSDLKYATNASGIWVVETVDSSDATDPTGLFTSIAVTTDGIPCITYYRGSGPNYYDLWYAVKPSTTWLKKEMAPGYLKYAHVVVDDNGYAGIAYPGKFLKDGP